MSVGGHKDRVCYSAPLLMAAKYAVSYARTVRLNPAARLLVFAWKMGEVVACSSSSASCKSAVVCALKMHSPYKLLHRIAVFGLSVSTIHTLCRTVCSSCIYTFYLRTTPYLVLLSMHKGINVKRRCAELHCV